MGDTITKFNDKVKVLRQLANCDQEAVQLLQHLEQQQDAVGFNLALSQVLATINMSFFGLNEKQNCIKTLQMLQFDQKEDDSITFAEQINAINEHYVNLNQLFSQDPEIQTVFLQKMAL